MGSSRSAGKGLYQPLISLCLRTTSTYPCHHEVLWETGLGPHYLELPTQDWPSPVCLELTTEDNISTALRLVSSRLERQWSYMWPLFVDFSSAFYAILSNRLVAKLFDLGKSHSIYLCIKDFLANHCQRVQHLVSAPGPPRAACWSLCPLLSTPMTAYQPTSATSSSSLAIQL